MKMDSYRRFVRSPLYQKCTLSSVEDKLLLQPERTGSLDNVASRSPSTSNKVKKKTKKTEAKGKHGGIWFINFFGWFATEQEIKLKQFTRRQE